MFVEDKIFEISQVVWRYQESRVITGDRIPRKPIRAGIDSMSVRCKGCGINWKASRSRGTLQPVAGSVRITCPGCGVESSIPNQLLNQL